MKRFEQKVIEKLGYYVYALIDPRDDKIFYIGKGNGDRVFQHCLAAINGDDATPKFDTIREIHNSGLKVRQYILRHRLSEEVALQMESLLIDFLTYTEFNTEHVLTNIQGGYHQWDEGIKTVQEIDTIYKCEKINIAQKDKGHILLVNLNKSYDLEKAKIGRVDLYEITRKFWRMSKGKAETIRYVLGVYRGIVRSVLNVKGHEWSEANVQTGEVFPQERCCFEGELDNSSPYMNTYVSDYQFGIRGAIRYIR